MRFFILGLPQRRYSDARVEKVAAQSSREIENAEMGCGFLGLPQRRYSDARVEKVAAQSSREIENAEMGCGFLGLPQRRYSNARVEKVVMVKFAAESFHTRGGGQKRNT